jgi:hypothetical protein
MINTINLLMKALYVSSQDKFWITGRVMADGKLVVVNFVGNVHTLMSPDVQVIGATKL